MSGWLRERGLFWKEWRVKRWLVAAFASAMVLVPLLLTTLASLNAEDSGWQTDVEIFLPVVVIVFTLAVVALGAMVLTREEQDPGSAFLYTLPVSRKRILAEKLGALATQWVVLALAMTIISILFTAGRDGTDNVHVMKALQAFWHMVTTALLGSLPVLALAAILGLHLRSTIVTFVFTPIFGIPILGILSIGGVFPAVDLWERLPNSFLLTTCLLTTAGLVGWMFFLFCRTAIQELGNTSRVLLALLFGVGATEAVFTVFLCNFRDLVFIILGI